MRDDAIREQPQPKGHGPAVHDRVIEDIAKRKVLGTQRYGEPLKPNNGRSAIVDAYQECLDLAAYLKQFLLEMEHITTVQELVSWFLRANGYDGLFNEYGECACLVDDLAPCGSLQSHCQPGYMGPCTCGEHDWHITPIKKEE